MTAPFVHWRSVSCHRKIVPLTWWVCRGQKSYSSTSYCCHRILSLWVQDEDRSPVQVHNGSLLLACPFSIKVTQTIGSSNVVFSQILNRLDPKAGSALLQLSCHHCSAAGAKCQAPLLGKKPSQWAGNS